MGQPRLIRSIVSIPLSKSHKIQIIGNCEECHNAGRRNNGFARFTSMRIHVSSTSYRALLAKKSLYVTYSMKIWDEKDLHINGTR
jgi:hypothetical protein